MLFVTPLLEPAEMRVLEAVRDLRSSLHYQLEEPRRWTGLLRRVSFARAIRASNRIEGYNVTLDDALAAVDAEEPLEVDRLDTTWAAITGYRNAMTYCLQLATDPHFGWSVDLLRSLHYMMISYDLERFPGRWRPGPIYIYDEQRQQQVYEGPDPDLVPGLMEELVARVAQEDSPPTISAAMAHLNLAMIHPFKDGNGRMARALQTLVLAREGIFAPALCSVEEYLGRNTMAYYDVLGEVGAGGWNPHHDARPWIRFMLTAHYRQALTIRRRVKEFSRLWTMVEAEVTAAGLPERAIAAVFEASRGARIRRSLYTTLADVEDGTGSRDLRALVEAGFLDPHGEKRGRYYVASPRLKSTRREIREAVADPLPDPFDLIEGKLSLKV